MSIVKFPKQTFIFVYPFVFFGDVASSVLADLEGGISFALLSGALLFFPIFWDAYEKTFNRKTIHSAWSKSGIWPFDPLIVLDDLSKRTLA